MAARDVNGDLTAAWTAVTRAASSPAFTERLKELSGVALHRSALVTLWRLASEGPRRISELADGVGVDVSTMSRLVRQLEREGLVERARHDDDLRCVQIRLTSAGLDTYEHVEDARIVILAEVMEDWSAADRAAFVRFMARFAQDFVTHSIGRRPVAVS